MAKVFQMIILQKENATFFKSDKFLMIRFKNIYIFQPVQATSHYACIIDNSTPVNRISTNVSQFLSSTRME